ALLGPALQPRVDFRGRDTTLLRDPHDVLVVRDAFGARELVDDVADRDDLLALRLADPGLDDGDVEAPFLAGDFAHPVLDDPYRTLRVFRVDRLAQPEPSAGLREPDDRLQLPRGDGHAGARGLPGLPDLQVLLFDDLHRLVRHHRVNALRIGDVLTEEVRVEMGREGFLEERRLFHGEARLASPPDLSNLVSFEDVLRELAIAVRSCGIIFSISSMAASPRSARTKAPASRVHRPSPNSSRTAAAVRPAAEAAFPVA